MNLMVKKFGGTSVGSTDRIKAVADRLIADKATYTHQVVVVSAMGDTTDLLVKLAKDISGTMPPNPREYDALVSTGENVSAALLSMALQSKGHDAISLSGPQAGIQTESTYSKAKILHVDPTRIQSELAQGKIVIVTGFQGLNADQDITTIGRGGSDTSAVVLAAALNCPVCEIYTDVDGVYTTDPRIEPKAKKLDQISYEEMLELASLGAGVLHPRSVECGKENGVEIHVRSSFAPQEGTIVKEANSMEVNKPVTGVAVSKNEAIISICGIQDDPGTASSLFTQLGEKAINIDMIIQSAPEEGVNSITYTVQEDDLVQAKSITENVAKELKASGVICKENISKVSIVGVGMISKPGIAARMFKTLGDNHINIHLISTSEIKVSCAIDAEKAQDAVRLLHKEFELDN